MRSSVSEFLKKTAILLSTATIFGVIGFVVPLMFDRDVGGALASALPGDRRGDRRRHAGADRSYEGVERHVERDALGKAEAKEGPMTMLIYVVRTSSSTVAIPLNPSLATAKGRLRTPSDQQMTSEAGSAE